MFHEAEMLSVLALMVLGTRRVYEDSNRELTPTIDMVAYRSTLSAWELWVEGRIDPRKRLEGLFAMNGTIDF